MTENENYSSKFIKKNLEASMELENSKLTNRNILLNSQIFSPDKKTITFPVNNFKFENKLCNKKNISNINKLENSFSDNQTKINSLNLAKNLNDLLTITTTNIYQNSNSDTTLQQQSLYYYNSLLQFSLNLEQQLLFFQNFLKLLYSTLFIKNDLLLKDLINDCNFLRILDILNTQQPIYYCFLCLKKLENHLMYILHWDLVHFKNNIISSKLKLNFLQELLKNNLKRDDLLANNNKNLVRFYINYFYISIFKCINYYFIIFYIKFFY